MARVFVGIGSNVEREKNIRAAVDVLARRYAPLALSAVYECAPVGFEGENFYNLVAGFDAAEPVEELLETLRAIENRHGRVRGGERFGPRTLDLDLLLYGDLVRHDARIELPRPEILKYAFVLRPLAELAPQARHPETGETYRELWEKFRPRLELRPVSLAL